MIRLHNLNVVVVFTFMGKKVSANRLTFSPTDPSFRLVASYLMAFQGFVSAVEIYNGDQPPVPWPADDTAVIDAAAAGQTLTFKPRALVEAMVKNRWPDEVSFEVEAMPPVLAGSAINLGVLENFMFGLGQSLITNFFEEQRDRLESHYGRVPNWPNVWNFARVVRNAMSHGGCITIRDQSRVAWKGLSYSSADNGRKIVNVDIWPGDLFILVKELERALP